MQNCDAKEAKRYTMKGIPKERRGRERDWVKVKVKEENQVGNQREESQVTFSCPPGCCCGDWTGGCLRYSLRNSPGGTSDWV